MGHSVPPARKLALGGSCIFAEGMTKKERANFVSGRLDELYPDPPIPLDHKDEYTLLVAVLLSAQCTDVRVNKTTPCLMFALADKPEKMAKQSVADP